LEGFVERRRVLAEGAGVLAVAHGRRAAPLPRRLRDHTWETFSANRNSDVRIGFTGFARCSC
jgi:hypothetical protein